MSELAKQREDPPAAASLDQGKLQLREFRRADLQLLHQIDQSCFPPGVAYSLTELERFICRPSAKTWVAEIDEGIVGFVSQTASSAIPVTSSRLTWPRIGGAAVWGRS
jgi:hypothetical protein